MNLADSEPTVSVVIPFYGSTELLQRALRSVRDQDFAEPVETIVVVDGSPKDLSAVRANFPDVVVITQVNAGAGVARNRGIDIAQGTFIAFLDADDYWLPSKLNVQVAAMRDTGAEWSQHSYLVVSPNMEVLRRVDTTRYEGDVLVDALLSFRIQTSTVMVRRESLRDGTLRFSADRIGQDGYFYIQFAANFPLLAIDETLGCFTWHGMNVGGRPEAQLWSRARTWKLCRDHVTTTLPLAGQFAYIWCAIAAKLLRYPRETPPMNRSGLAAKFAYAPSYFLFHLLAKRISSK